jgi:DNA-binding NarL/FixJ family response regulator
MKTIFLAEGEQHVRDALRLMLEHRAIFEISGEAGTAESSLAQVCKQPPDVILLDWNLPGLDPKRLLSTLRQCCPAAVILATSVQAEQEKPAMKSGVDAFLLKQLPPDQYIARLLEAIHQSLEHKYA